MFYAFYDGYVLYVSYDGEVLYASYLIFAFYNDGSLVYFYSFLPLVNKNIIPFRPKNNSNKKHYLMV
jgi:hypothetical protein